MKWITGKGNLGQSAGRFMEFSELICSPVLLTLLLCEFNGGHLSLGRRMYELRDVITDTLSSLATMPSLSRGLLRLPALCRPRGLKCCASRSLQTSSNSLFKVSEEVQDAIQTGKPVVALETTIYTHGMLLIDLPLGVLLISI